MVIVDWLMCSGKRKRLVERILVQRVLRTRLLRRQGFH